MLSLSLGGLLGFQSITPNTLSRSDRCAFHLNDLSQKNSADRSVIRGDFRSFFSASCMCGFRYISARAFEVSQRRKVDKGDPVICYEAFTLFSHFLSTTFKSVTDSCPLFGDWPVRRGVFGGPVINERTCASDGAIYRLSVRMTKWSIEIRVWTVWVTYSSQASHFVHLISKLP